MAFFDLFKKKNKQTDKEKPSEAFSIEKISSEETPAEEPKEFDYSEAVSMPEENESPDTISMPEESESPDTISMPVENESPDTVSMTEENESPDTVSMPVENASPDAVSTPEESASPDAASMPEEGASPDAVSMPEEGASPDAISMPEESEEPAPESVPEKKGFFKKIFAGLDKTRKNILGSVESVLKNFAKIDEELYEELEEALIAADIGVPTAMSLIEKLRARVKEEKATEIEQVKTILIDEITKTLEKDSTAFVLASPSVLLVIGVNGVGKTTTIGKLAANLKAEGKNVVLAAADTFRAAAIDQLEIWGQRSGIPVIKHQENTDPGAVVFDAVQAAKARKADVLICDTAGRLHNKKNLMEELRKISRIIAREYPEAQTEVFIVLDATTGQNALQQATVFKEICDITGIVLTKLDGTAKGGIVIAIKNELNIPIRFIGVGEGIDDLQPFDAAQFAKALFDGE